MTDDPSTTPALGQPPRAAVTVAGGGGEQLLKARQIARTLSLPLLDTRPGALPADHEVATVAGADVLLVVTPHRLELRQSVLDTGPVYCDFVGGSFGQRHRGGRREAGLLARAVGLKRKRGGAAEDPGPPSVIDATAGLGRDAVLLAALGCRVTAVERSSILHALVEDGLRRAAADPQLARSVEANLRLVHADARRYLHALPDADRPDVIYLDPMFPPRRKSALVKKEMRVCRLVAGDDPDADRLLEAALSAARRRVAVKRPAHAPPLPGPPPTLAHAASRRAGIRYDIYIPPSRP